MGWAEMEVLGILGLAVVPGNEAPFLAPGNPGIWLPESGLLHIHSPTGDLGAEESKRWERDGQRQGHTGRQKQRHRHRDKKRLNKRQHTHALETHIKE